MSKRPFLHGSTSRRVDDIVPARLLIFAAFALLLAVCFLSAFKALASLALHDELHAHVFLVPFISLYILSIIRDQLPKTYPSSFPWAILALTVGVVFLIVASRWGTYWLTASILSFLCFLAAGGFALLGKHWMKAAAFPFAFLIFITPLPEPVVQWLETASKLASAECASFFLHLTGIPVLRDGTIFQLPGITLEVAQECSGIRSSLVLLIASILASYLFLKRPSHRLILVLIAIPLGALRNGFRITVIGLLCVQFGPQMIHSIIHKRGGPVFFVLSLIPLIAVLWVLRRNEARFRRQMKTQSLSAGDQSEILTEH
jgi:exosortase C (VPDSG-CTERM-specific)